MSYGMVPPPESLSLGSRPSFHSSLRKQNEEKMEQYNQLTRQNLPKKSSDTDSYFDDSDEDESLGRNSKQAEEDDEEDPLDSFMAGVNEQAKSAKKESELKEQQSLQSGEFSGGQSGRDDIEQEDMQESYFKFLEDYQARHEDEDEVHEYDEDGNIIWTWKRIIEPLPSIDHSTISYKKFNKKLYKEHESISALSSKQVFEFRMSQEIRVFGHNIPKPVSSFGHFMFDKILISQIRKAEFERPTAIQCQAIPSILDGRDVIGLAETGSGKTLAYIWPAIVHITAQEELREDEGPIVLVVVPTRELAIQIYQQALFYCKPYDIRVVCAYGGGLKYEQKKALEQGAEIVICTPGRIIDMIKMKATNFLRTTFLVFDEVDRMFDLGFEAQVKSIADHIRPDRQCLMFSATMKPKVEKLAIHALNDPIKIICGDFGEVNADVDQTIVVLPDIQSKYEWLYKNIVKLISMGKVIIFVGKKTDVEDVAQKLRYRNVDLVVLHGDMHQHERNEAIEAFRSQKPAMVATDVAARGLDIPSIRNVVNFDVAKDIETHVHRVGRTGRAGQQGFAHTLITCKDSEFSAHLVRNFESVGHPILPDLLQVALKCPWFKQQQDTRSQQGGSSVGAVPGVGVKQRLGLGFSQNPAGVGRLVAPTSSFNSADQHCAVAKPTISKTIERAKSMIGSSGVAGASKVDLMRSALKGSYQNSFKAASDEGTKQRLPASDPRPEWKKQLYEYKAPKTDSSNDGTAAPKKRSRWE